MKTNFAEVKVEVVDCPDLTQAPFHLAAPGICGDETIVEFGGVPYLLPLVDRSRIYDLVPMLNNVEGYKQKGFFTMGAGAGKKVEIMQGGRGREKIDIDFAREQKKLQRKIF